MCLHFIYSVAFHLYFEIKPPNCNKMMSLHGVIEGTDRVELFHGSAAATDGSLWRAAIVWQISGFSPA